MKTMKKNLLPKVFFISLLMIGITHLAKAIDPLTLNIADGTIVIDEGGYRIGAFDATLHPYTGSYIITGTGNNIIYVLTNADITISKLTINNPGEFGFLAFSNANVNLTLKGKNSIQATYPVCVYADGLPTTGILSISGDTLYATSSASYPAIGSAYSKIGKIEINGGYIVAKCNGLGTGIGYSSDAGCTSVVINNGVIKASSAQSKGIGADNIVINGGSVNASSVSTTVTNSLGSSLYCVTVPHHGSLSIPVTSGTGETKTYTFPCFHENDDNFYIYLPNGSYKFSTGGMQYAAMVKGAAVTAMLDSIDGDGNIALTGVLVTVKDSSYTIGSQPYKYTGHRYTFSGSSTNYGVAFTGGAHDTIVLNNLNIKASQGAAFEVNGGQSIPVLVKGTNQLVSIAGPGLQKTSASGLITISGDTLIATGGSYSAGIGGAIKGIADSITITSGYIVATGGEWAAGIGGGSNAAGKHITIRGGKVITSSTANMNGYSGSGIGGGYPAGASDILISGGYVKATSSDANHAIGGYYGSTVSNVQITGGVVEATTNAEYTLPEGIEISGGTVFAQMTSKVDQYFNFAFNSGSITGGSVNLVGADGKTVSVYYYDHGNTYTEHRPVNADSTLLYRSMYRVPGIVAMTKLDSIKINGTAWNCTDLYTDTIGRVYLWVPQSDSTHVSISTGGQTYVYAGKIADYDNYYEANPSKGVKENGNYFYLLPVSIAKPENGTLTVSTGGVPLTDAALVCKGFKLTTATTPATGYKLSGIMLNQTLATKDTTFAISDTLAVSASFSIRLFTLTYTAQNGTIAITSNGESMASGASVSYGSELTIAAIPDEGYKLDTLKVNGNDVASGSALTVISDVTVSAVFSRIATGTTSLSENTTQVYAYGGAIYVQAAIGSSVNIYSISGRLITTGNVTSSLQSFVVPSGALYMVKISYANDVKTTKCLVY
jgi:hypothetical protein